MKDAVRASTTINQTLQVNRRQTHHLTLAENLFEDTKKKKRALGLAIHLDGSNKPYRHFI